MDQVPHKQKTALITGAAGGLGVYTASDRVSTSSVHNPEAYGYLGRAIAEQFLLEGANVVVCDINQELIADFKDKVSAAYPECTLVLKTDITDEAALDSMFEEAEKTFGKIDYVVNSAGMMDRFDPAGELERAMWDRVIALNLTAPTMVTKRAVNLMLKHEAKGSIVNIASVAAFRGFCSGAAYTVSKHGLMVDSSCVEMPCQMTDRRLSSGSDEEHRSLLRTERHPL